VTERWQRRIWPWYDEIGLLLVTCAALIGTLVYIAVGLHYDLPEFITSGLWLGILTLAYLLLHLVDRIYVMLG
jgi:hypothetical protein